MKKTKRLNQRRSLFLLGFVALTTRASALEEVQTARAQHQHNPSAYDSSTSSSSVVEPHKASSLTIGSIHLDDHNNFLTLMGAENNEMKGTNDYFHLSSEQEKESSSFSFTWRDWIGLVVWFCAAGVATSCGVGGGGIYVPLGILWLLLPPKSASGLSQASIFGASLGGLLLNVRLQHPQQTTTQSNSRQSFSRPLIDYDMALFLAPLEMAGAVLGVLIQSIFPNWLYLSVAAMVLGFTSNKTFQKYHQVQQQEINNSTVAGAATATESAGRMSDPLLRIGPTGSHEDQADVAEESFKEQELAPQDNNHNDAALRHRSHSNEPESKSSTVVPSGDNQSDDNPSSDTEQCRYFLERDSRQYPTEKLTSLAILWIGLSLVTLLKGGKGVESLVGIDCTSPWYGVLIGVQFIWTLGFSAVSGRKLVQEYAQKQLCGYPFHATDISWTYEKMKVYAAGTFLAGIVAGLIGIGGGMVLGPLMIFVGVHPQVSTATTATMIVLTSSSVAVVFITSGMVPLYYALAFFTSCFCGALVGKQYIDGYVKRTGKASLLIFLLATIIALATIGCMVIVVLKLSEANWQFDGLQKFCNK